jgi:hypothetical protein
MTRAAGAQHCCFVLLLFFPPLDGAALQLCFCFATAFLHLIGINDWRFWGEKNVKKRRSSSPLHKEKGKKGSQASQTKRVLLLREGVGESNDGAPQMPPHGVLLYAIYVYIYYICVLVRHI